jgi:hypothetical protein
MDQKSLLKRLLLSSFSFTLLFFALNLAFADDVRENTILSETRETYHYQAVPAGENTDRRKESIEIELSGSGDGLEYVSKVISAKSIETIKLRMDKEGRFVSGLRGVSNRQNQKLSAEQIWEDENKVYIQRDSDGTRKPRQIKLPTDKPTAVDGSLLILLRSFPFNTGTKWNIFMIDFSGYSVTITVHQAKVENIVVQPGEFECYRMEVVVGLPVIRPTLTYWLTTDKPHFLVKNLGKRGPFTSTYMTTLVSKDSGQRGNDGKNE